MLLPFYLPIFEEFVWAFYIIVSDGFVIVQQMRIFLCDSRGIKSLTPANSPVDVDSF